MSILDEASGEVSNVGYSADTSAALGGQPSLFESAANLVTKAVPLTGLSIVNSFLNTPIAFANMFGANIEPFKAENELEAVGADSYKNYYQVHQQGIEAAGLLIGSFAPGMIGVKAVRAMQAGKIDGIASRSTNLFMPPTNAILEDALQKVTTRGSLANSMNADKWQVVALGFRDQAVQTLGFETATLLTMSGSPLIDGDSWNNILWDTGMGVAFGGAIGGVLEGFSAFAKFRKALSAADKGSKAQEIFTDSGFINKSMWDGNSLGADNALNIISSLAEIPPATNEFGAFRLNETQKAGRMKFQKTMLDTFAQDEDHRDVVAAVSGRLIREIDTHGTSAVPVLEDTLSRLTVISRIDSGVEVPTSDYFHVNKITSADARARITNGQNPTMDDMFTTAPSPDADVTRRFQMRPFSVGGPQIGTFAQTFDHPVTGAPMQLFKTAADAFKSGMDLFVTEKGFIAVNPRAPNIIETPLAGQGRVLNQKEYKLFNSTGQLPEGASTLPSAPVYFDVESGTMFANQPPIVPGDLSGLKVNRNNVQYTLSKQAITNVDAVAKPLSVDTDTLTATSRYLWSLAQGILRRGTTIAEDDLPMMDAFYTAGVRNKAGWTDWLDKMEKKGIGFSEMDAPASSVGMYSEILDRKVSFITDLMAKHPELSAADVALRANVSEDFISSNFMPTKIEDVIRNPERLGQINTTRNIYNVGNALMENGNIIRGVADTQRRMQIVHDAARTAMGKYFGPDFENFLADAFRTSDAKITDDAPGLVTFANAEYGTLGERLQGIGRAVANFTAVKNTEDLAVLSPLAAGIRNNPLAALEANLTVMVRRSTPYNYTLLPEDIAARHFPGATNPDGIMILDRALVRNKVGEIVSINHQFVPDGFQSGMMQKDIQAASTSIDKVGLRTFYELSPEVSAMERGHMEINNRRNGARNAWYEAVGLSTRLPMDIMYAPPVDVSRYPFVALVRPKPGMAFADDGLSVIAAESAASLQQKMLAIDTDAFDVFTKDQIKLNKQLQNDYEMQRNFNSGLANSEMKRKGIFNNFVPDAGAEAYLADLQTWHSRQNVRLIRDYVEMGNAQIIAEMRNMGDNFTGIARSQIGGFGLPVQKAVDNPYDRYIKTMLNIKDEPYKFWTDANEKLEAFADSAFRTVRNTFAGYRNGIASLEDVSKKAMEMGLGNPYEKVVDALQAHTEVFNQLPPGRALSRGISMINGLQAATAIRLDTFQTLINVVSNPIMTLTELRSVRNSLQVPGTNIQMPGTFRIITDAVKDWWDPAVRSQWIDRLERSGIIRPDTKDYFKMQDDMSLPFGKAFNENEWLKKIENAADTGAKWTGSALGENFVRFTTAMIGRRAFEAAGIEGLDLMDRISTFVSRVHGNYVASQRPVAFQGPLGRAASLFQTYQLGLLQNLMRYVANGEAKTLATFAGLQATTFGIQGLPGVQMLNQYLIGDAASNPAHKDLYSQMTNYLDKPMADWFLYGGVSNVLNMGVYNRGDVNPRFTSIIPVNPLEFPAINGQIQFWSSLYKTLQTTVNGGQVWETLLTGLEHNGLSRPLGGLAQLMQGYSTTSAGKLVQNIRYPWEDGVAGWSDMQSIANFGRIFGARPLDEAITLDANFRKTAYEANDQTKLKALSIAARTYLTGNGAMPEDVMQQFATRYTAAGGDMKNFAREIMDWQKSANVSVANSVFKHLEKPLNQQMMLQMGGMPLPDYQVPNPQRQAVPLTPVGTTP